MARVAGALRALSTPGLQSIARAQLKEIVSERTSRAEPSLEEQVAWLNGAAARCPSRGSWWTSVRWAVRHLRKVLGLSFVRRGQMLGVAFKDPSSTSGGHAELLANNLPVIARAFRAGVREHHFRS